jgi:hypothetical protein
MLVEAGVPLLSIFLKDVRMDEYCNMKVDMLKKYYFKAK